MVHSATLEEPFGDFLYSYTRSVRSSNLILGIYPKEIKIYVHTQTYTQMFTAALCIAQSKNYTYVHHLLNG